MELIAEEYKQTEVGLIPVDWEVKAIQDAFDICNNLRLPISEDVRKTMQGEYPYYGPTKIQDYLNEYRVDGEYALIGEDGDHFLKWNDIPMTQLAYGRFNVNNHAHLIKGKSNRTITKWFYYFFKNRDITSHLTRQGAGRYKLSKGTLVQIPIAVPPTISEQTAIATALSDADALISSLVKLIAKKRNIKQGAMQKLLEPKDGWEVTTLLKIVENKKELFDDGDWVEAEHITNSGVRLIQTGNIGIGTFVEKENRKYIFPESFEKLGCKELRVGDLLICRLADPAGRACILPFIGEEKVITSVDVTIFRPDVKLVNRQFLTYIFSTSNWFKAISELCGGTTHKRISRSALGKIRISVPEISEQGRIANILADMDTETNALETKLEKYKNIKLGMMQNLLTGKIRLV